MQLHSFISSRWLTRTFPRQLIIRTGVLLCSILLVPVLAHGQLQNGEFNSLNGWFPFGPCNIALSSDAYQGGSAAQVTNRALSWQGIAQSLIGVVEADKDYHITSFVKLLGSTGKAIQLQIKHTDDRGTRFYKIGEIRANDTEWTLLQTGFHFQSNGVTTELDLIFNASELGPGQFDFDYLVDSVQIVENNWQDAAAARIEQFRKRDAELTFVDSTGQPAVELQVDVRQVNHDFGFGSTLNHEIAYNQTYEDFFKEHYERATFEFFTQWRATESVRGVEDYRIADISLDFAEANGIKIKGHALAYPLQEFLPDWLIPLAPNEVQAELEQRVTNVASRYEGRLTGWDVSNEMLEHDWLAQTLGESYRPWIFQRARELCPDAILSTNEFGIEDSVLKAKRYRQLIGDLLDNGAEIDEIGIQSHFLNYVSPKGIEIAIEELAGFGIDFYFSEFDFTNVDDVERAKGLENFYRYAFSRPEANGITMWGFWAGSHWRGPEASIVDLDWTVNAAGQKYFELIDEWTTSFNQEVPSEEALQFRGFHGDYLITTFDPEESITNYHLVFLPKGNNALSGQLEINDIDGSLTIYGTPGDDVFEFDFQEPDRFVLNGELIVIDDSISPNVLRFFGGGGNDRLETTSRPRNQNFIFNGERLSVDGEIFIEFPETEAVVAVAQTLGSTVTFNDTAGDDFFMSFFDFSSMSTAQTEMRAENFRFVFSRSFRGGFDTAWIFGAPNLTDRFYSNVDTLSIRTGARHRRASGFDDTLMLSNGPFNVAVVDLPASPNKVTVYPTETAVENNGKSLKLFDFTRTAINGADNNDDSVDFRGRSLAQTLRIFSDFLFFHGSGFQVTVNDINRSTFNSSDGISSRVIIRDSAGNDTLDVDETTMTYSNSQALHSASGMDSVRGYSTFGGTDTATVSDSAPTTILVGDWE